MARSVNIGGVPADRAPTDHPAKGPSADDALAIADSMQQPQRFESIFEAHHRAVWGFLARRAGRDVADDLAGEVFTIAFARRASFDPALGTVRSWIFGIAANLLRTRHRSSIRSGRAFERLTSGREAQPVTADPAWDEEDRQELTVAAQALARLPESDREILLLFAWEELSYVEIAVVLDVPVGTVRSRLARARQRLRELMASSGQVTVEKSHPRTVTDG